MIARTLATLLGVVLVLNGTGCTSCHYKSFSQSMQACEQTELPIAVRQKVYLFAMNGLDASDLTGLCKMRDRVCEAGFSKVYTAQRADAAWYEREVRRVSWDDPDVRVVLLGVGTAADKMIALANGAAADGVVVDSLILLDPVCDKLPTETAYRTVVVRSHNWRGGRDIVGTENVVVAKLGHLTMAKNPAVVEKVVEVMTDSAQRVGPLPGDPYPTLPLTDCPNPTPRPLSPSSEPTPDADWDFLKPSAPIARPISLEPLPVAVGQASPPATVVLVKPAGVSNVGAFTNR